MVATSSTLHEPLGQENSAEYSADEAFRPTLHKWNQRPVYRRLMTPPIVSRFSALQFHLAARVLICFVSLCAAFPTGLPRGVAVAVRHPRPNLQQAHRRQQQLRERQPVPVDHPVR